MEKRTPHCKLAVVKSMLAAGKVRATVSALAGGAALGFGFQEILGVVAAHALELTVLDGVPIVSFKEL
jgi:motility quorum-sensing regulator/GCU-specific mRNA interferase toxin